jgi:hypothetical protein
MPGYGQMRRASAQQKAADGSTSDYQTDVRVYGPATDRLSESLNQGPQAQSLLQMQRALDEGPRVQSQLALQRALNRREAEPAQDDTIEASPQPASAPVQTKPNATGLPDQLKAGVEQLSGLAMDDVRVHYNSAKPAAVQAHAYAQGTNIHLAPGQEKHLPHEAWHVVQQKQGRVKPTLQLKGVAINDDAGLEREAAVMGHRASSAPVTSEAASTSVIRTSRDEATAQRFLDEKVVAAYQNAAEHWYKANWQVNRFARELAQAKQQYGHGANPNEVNRLNENALSKANKAQSTLGGEAHETALWSCNNTGSAPICTGPGTTAGVDTLPYALLAGEGTSSRMTIEKKTAQNPGTMKSQIAEALNNQPFGAINVTYSGDESQLQSQFDQENTFWRSGAEMEIVPHQHFQAAPVTVYNPKGKQLTKFGVHKTK